MPHKGKLRTEEKVRLVEEYLGGKFSTREFEQRYGIHNQSLRDWIRIYQSEGMEGLAPKTKNQKYTSELKTQVVTEYLAGVCSLHDICRRYRISGQSVVRKWIRKYTCHEELKTNGIGREVYMTSGRKTTLEERVEIVEFCISSGKNYKTTIEKYNISYQQIYGWIRKYEKSGAEGLSDHRGKPKDKASMTEIERLRAELRLKEAQNLRLQMENDLLKKLDEIERRRG